MSGPDGLSNRWTVRAERCGQGGADRKCPVRTADNWCRMGMLWADRPTSHAASVPLADARGSARSKQVGTTYFSSASGGRSPEGVSSSLVRVRLFRDIHRETPSINTMAAPIPHGVALRTGPAG